MRASQAADVAVVGAGPAGTSAAITLARLGRQVMLIDKATFPRDKCCGDGLTAAALRRVQDLGLEPSSVKSWEPVDQAIVIATDGFRLDLPLPRDDTQYAASARRADLDAELVELARRAGVHVIEGHAVVGANALADGAGVELDLDDGRQVRSHYSVACDGAWSPVRKALGLADPGYFGEWQAGRQYFEHVGPKAKKLWVWFEPDMIPGYAWSFPLPGGNANVGYGVIRDPYGPPGGLRGQRIDFLDRPHMAEVLGPAAAASSPWKAWPIPARIGRTALSGLGGRVLFAGDAARACDPMTGEGIAQALETAELAARAIARAGPHRPGAAAARYERQIRWGMALDEQLSLAFSAVLAHGRGSAKSLRIADANDRFRHQFTRWMFEDYPRAFMVTPHRWRRAMFTQPGAFGPTAANGQP
jgi:geranylgeranyl reductase family protein